MTASVDRGGPRTSTRVRAALAAGLVFGLTAGLTVASWTDAEFSRPTFTASSFAVQTSLAGGAYTSATIVAASIDGLYPGGAASYLPLLVKTAASSVGGSVRLSSAVNSVGLAPALRYRIVQSTASCTAALFVAGASYAAGSTSTYQSASAALAPTAPVAVATAGGSVAGYCIELSVVPGADRVSYQGKTAVVSWTVSGVSS